MKYVKLRLRKREGEAGGLALGVFGAFFSLVVGR